MGNSGNLYIIAAPSGTGKTTLVKALVESMSNIMVSISHTTRPQRPGEIHGVHYYFIQPAEFQQMIDHDDFIEHAIVFNNAYGTSRKWVEETLAKGIDVILEIDWQGQEQIKQLLPHAAISIFILPPTLDVLRNRLINRQQDHFDVIQERLRDVREAVSHIHNFDYVVMNDDFAHALHDLETIIEAGRLLQKRQSIKFVSLLQKLAMIEE